ncbi:MAG: hypothetical protein WC301_06160, partial [Candidatus Omnitrophota bacterium]
MAIATVGLEKKFTSFSKYADNKLSLSKYKDKTDKKTRINEIFIFQGGIGNPKIEANSSKIVNKKTALGISVTGFFMEYFIFLLATSCTHIPCLPAALFH